MKTHLLFFGIGLALAAAAPAQTVTHAATGSRSYRSTGPATPLANQDNLNIGGTNQGGFASWAAIDFTFSASDFGGAVSSVSQFTLSLYKDDQAFTSGGAVDFWVAPLTTLALTDTSLKFDAAFSGGLDPAAGTLGALHHLGSATVAQANGATDGQLATFLFTVDAATSSFITDQINSGDHVLRVVLTPGAASTVLTFAGLTSPNFGDPSLAVTAVPEPATMAMGLGLAALVGAYFANRARRTPMPQIRPSRLRMAK